MGETASRAMKTLLRTTYAWNALLTVAFLLALVVGIATQSDQATSLAIFFGSNLLLALVGRFLPIPRRLGAASREWVIALWAFGLVPLLTHLAFVARFSIARVPLDRDSVVRFLVVSLLDAMVSWGITDIVRDGAARRDYKVQPFDVVTFANVVTFFANTGVLRDGYVALPTRTAPRGLLKADVETIPWYVVTLLTNAVAVGFLVQASVSTTPDTSLRFAIVVATFLLLTIGFLADLLDPNTSYTTSSVRTRVSRGMGSGTGPILLAVLALAAVCGLGALLTLTRFQTIAQDVAFNRTTAPTSAFF